MDDLCVLSYGLKFLKCYREMEYWNQDIFQRGRLFQKIMLLKDATWGKLRAKILLTFQLQIEKP